MRHEIVVSATAANALLEELSAYPIKMLPVVTHLQQWLAARFADEDPPPNGHVPDAAERAEAQRTLEAFAPLDALDRGEG
jgi:hypothetical protein